MSKSSILALALIACGFVSACDKKGGQPVAKNKGDEIYPVQTVIVQQENLIRTINAVGTTRFRRETPLGFTTSGKVAAVRFKEGDYVKRGALLAALETVSIRADTGISPAERQQAQADFERVRALYADGWVTKAHYETAEAAATGAAARGQQTGPARGTAQLFAASSGIVISRFVEPGQNVSAGSPALILGETDEGFVFRVPVIDPQASKLRVGMPAQIQLEALGAEPVTALISEIDGRANETSGAYSLQFRLPARAGLRSGQIGSAKINLPAANDGALQIPASALFGVRTGEGLVYVVDAATSRVETRNVAIDRVTDGFVVVKGGLKPGDVIVVSGAEKIRNGARVRSIPMKAKGSTAVRAEPSP